MKHWLFEQYCRAKHFLARCRYTVSGESPEYLSKDDFKNFLRVYEKHGAFPIRDYSFEGMSNRAGERCAMLNAIENLKGKDVLEIGAADGLVLKECLRYGARSAVAVDIEDKLHEEAKRSGVKIFKESAESMASLPDSSFDWIYGFSSLEHITNIHAVLTESLRVLRPGGVIYFEAGPLHYSPWGKHYYSILKIPYVHILFRPEMLDEYAKLAEKTYPYTNRLSALSYFDLLKDLPKGVLVQDFKHGYDWYHSDMILRYPSVFKSKHVDFDSFFIDTIKIILRKNSNK